MKIYTSYYTKMKDILAKDIFPIGISQYPPAFFDYPNIISVAPTKSILFEYKNEPDKERYKKRYYNEVLSKLDVQRFIDEIKSISSGKDVALCCFEKPNDFCHRHLLADFLNEKLALEITELQFDDKCHGIALF